MTEQFELRGIKRPLRTYPRRQVKPVPAAVVTKTPSGFPAYKTALEKRRKDVEAAKKTAEVYKVKAPKTQRELRIGGTPLRRQLRLRRERIVRRLARETALGRARKELVTQERLEKAFAPKWKAYQVYQARLAKVRAWNLAVKFYRKGVFYRFVSGREGTYLRKLWKTQGSFRPDI